MAKVNDLPATLNTVHLQISGEWPDERIRIGYINVWDDDDEEQDSYLEVFVNNGHIFYVDVDWDDDFGRYVVETHTDTELLIRFDSEERGWYIEYEEIFKNCEHCENWADEECHYSSEEDCRCQQYGECPPDCTDCNNWEECGYESYEDCQCQQYGEDCPEPPEPERTRIVEVISNILSDMVDDDNCELQSWQYNDMATSNVKLDKGKPSPTAVCYQVTDFEYDLRTGIRREKANVLVAFLQKENKLDADGLEQDQIIKQMSDIAFEFLKNVMDEGSLRVLNDKIKLKSTFLRSDSNRTGVVIELELEEKSGTCLQ